MYECVPVFTRAVLQSNSWILAFLLGENIQFSPIRLTFKYEFLANACSILHHLNFAS